MNIERLKIARERKGKKSQKEIADLLEVKQQQYSKYELGINSIPIEKLCKLADYYETSIDYLVGRTNKK